MNQFDFSWKTSDQISFQVIILSVFFFCVYWFIYDSNKIKLWFQGHYPGDAGKIRSVLFTKFSGFILMGIIPALISLFILPDYAFSDLGISFGKDTNLLSLYWILGLGAIIIPMNWFAARREKTLNMYPQIRIKEWDPALIILYSLGWVMYLFGYEFLFRGFLFFPIVKNLGVWPAIAINIFLYVATHIPKGMDETIGAAPLGLVLCLITLQTGTIWVAFVVHVFLALSNSLFALYFNPEMKVVTKRKMV